MTAPPAAGVRLPYDQLPDRVAAAVADICGGPVLRHRDLTGGFSPGCAALVTTASGTCFVKAVGTTLNSASPVMHRREIGILGALAGSPVDAPALIGSHDDGDWVVLVTEAVPGAVPALPWRPEGIDSLVRAIDNLNQPGVTGALLGALAAEPAEEFWGWRTLAAAPAPALDAWTLRRLERLAELEVGWTGAAAGDGLLHFDIRADNLLVSEHGARLVDWAWATRGNPLVDVVAAAPAVAMQGGPRPAELLSLTAVGRSADRAQLRVLVATIAGHFVEHGLRPAPPGLPTVREFQRAQGVEALRWLTELVD